MPTTSNFGWTTPADTDLVKDGAAAIRTLGNGIDTSFLDLKGGTTGQVLAKASNTDLDFTWSAADPLSILDAKGDLISATAADTPARLAVGTNGQFLSADSSTATGLNWVAAPSGQLTLSEIATGSVTSGTSLSLTSLSNYDTLKFKINNITTSASNQFSFRINSSSSAVYDYVLWGPTTNNTSTYDGDAMQNRNYDATATSVSLHPGSTSKFNSSTNNIFVIDFYNCKASGFTTFEIQAFFAPDFGSTWRQFVLGRGIFKTAATVSSIQFNTTSAFTAGSYNLWGG